MIDIRDHGGNFGGRGIVDYGSYIAYTTRTVKSVATTTTDFLLGVAYDESTDRFYVLTVSCILNVFDGDLNLISSTTLRKNPADILYNIPDFDPYGVFIAENNRIYLTGKASSGGYPVIAEISINNAGSPTLIKVLKDTVHGSQTYVSQWELAKDYGIFSSIGWTGTVVHYDLDLNIISAYILNNSVGNSLYKGDINYRKGLTGFVQTSNNAVIVKDNANKTWISITGNSYSCCRIQNNYTFILTPDSRVISIFDNATFVKIASINLPSEMSDSYALFVTYDRNDDFVYAILPGVNKVYIVDAISGSIQCVATMPFATTSGAYPNGQRPFLTRKKFICSALNALSFQEIEIKTVSRKVGKII